MACNVGPTPLASGVSPHRPLTNRLLLAFSVKQPLPRIRGWRVRATTDGGSSYLDMWKNAVDRGRKAVEFQKIAENTSVVDNGGDAIVEDLEKKSEEFEKILEVSKEERDRIQRMQVIDRASAAIAAARAALKETIAKQEEEGSGLSLGESEDPDSATAKRPFLGRKKEPQQGMQNGGSIFVPRSETPGKETPGPDFWSWTPPADSDSSIDDFSNLQIARAAPAFQPPSKPVVEKERSKEVLPIPFQSKLNDNDHTPPLPPLQSLMEVEKVEVSESTVELPSLKEEQEHVVEFSAHAAEAAEALAMAEELPYGVQPDGSRWWKETGIEQRPDGVICRWTVRKGVSADKAVEWQEKYWEASDELGYKELGSEKSGRDATGSVWREYWRESMRQESGLVHLEKTADKWGKNGQGDEWQEQWWEHYNSSGQADKWAHKWCSIDPTTPLDAGHAHVWHERWGEEYDGQGGSIKYTDKWAERCEDGGWTKWGDKWDENFDPNGHGVKQGETWWEGKYGERWNRTWGEGHNGSGWVHKYGKSSSGEHWDTHEPQETWYERFPHFGFYHCYDNSVQLREVPKPSDMA